MRVCIVGGGNIGTALACHIKHTVPSARVSIFTRRPGQFSQTLRCNDWENGTSYEVSVDCISDNAALAARDADIVFVALPHFAVERAFESIAPHVAREAFIGVLPGGGGCEFYFDRYFEKTQTLFGFARVPFIARLAGYGHEVNLQSWKPYSVVGVCRQQRLDAARNIIEDCGLKTRPAPNYLCVALTPTNPVLHTSRIYDMFGNYARGHVFQERFRLYVDWTDHASGIMLVMDDELHELLDHISGLDTSAIRRLTEHYEAPTVRAMTAKISGIAAFQSIYAPLKPAPGNAGFVADTDSRMFTEDFPWGLAIFRAYCGLFGTAAPTMDRVLQWYAAYLGLNWYVDGEFRGPDLRHTGIPQRYGITSREELLRYYS